MADGNDLPRQLREWMEENESDLFVYNGWLFNQKVREVLFHILAKANRRSRATLVLTTLGGDAHAAYRLMRCLQRLYGKIRLFVVGPCKSAGTLAAMGADELVFGPLGEIGPLDAQLRKPDEVVFSESGLDSMQALEVVRDWLYQSFYSTTMQSLEDTEGALSTKTAAEIATHLAVGLVTPVAEQIDPHRLGEVQRSLRIATFYGERLNRGNLTGEALAWLVQRYPSHSFVIDAEEAMRLFNNVRYMTDEETQILLGCYGPAILEPVPPGRDGAWDADEIASEDTGGDDDEPETANRGSGDAGASETGDGTRQRSPEPGSPDVPGLESTPVSAPNPPSGNSGRSRKGAVSEDSPGT